MSFSEAFLDELRLRLDLGRIVGRRVALAKAGRIQSGLCPFHNEKTPSFTVNEDKGFYHCFGCGAHGDVIAFVRETEGLEFREAVERLAEEAGLALPDETPEQRAVEARRAGLREALDAAAAAWHDCLLGSQGTAARAYLEQRGVSAESIARFRLGWAAGPLALPRDRFPEPLLIEAGLLRCREDGSVGPLFRNRLIFPIADRQGRVIAFGGRVMDDRQPKYLNSPASPLFDKSATLYGLDLARDGAAKSGRGVVVEGYLDVVAVHQAGLTEVVAPLGTAITDRHFSALWRLAPQVVLCLDGDKAGQNAAERAISVALPLLSPGRSLRFAPLPPQHDPDSLIRDEGVEAFRERLDTALPLSEMIWRGADTRCHPHDSPEQLAAFERAILARLSLMPDGVGRNALLGEFRRRLRSVWDESGPTFAYRNKVIAPLTSSPWAVGLWERLREAGGETEETPVRKWLESQGVSWPAVVGTLGGVGFVRAKKITAKPAPSEGWAGPKVPLWQEHPEGDGLVVLPAWEGMPGSALIDLVAWNPRTGAVLRKTGTALILGSPLRDEVLGYEVRGLSRPLRVTASPLDWLRGLTSEQRSVLVVDWSRLWEALGGLSSLIADNREMALKLEKAVLPPAPKPPEVGYVVGGA